MHSAACIYLSTPTPYAWNLSAVCKHSKKHITQNEINGPKRPKAVRRCSSCTKTCQKLAKKRPKVEEEDYDFVYARMAKMEPKWVKLAKKGQKQLNRSCNPI